MSNRPVMRIMRILSDHTLLLARGNYHAISQRAGLSTSANTTIDESQ
ncbi:MAG: hypothetical protein AB8B84_06750 [Granulosicoccus sp.]